MKLESLKNFELSNNQLANINGSIGGPARLRLEDAFSDSTGAGVLDYGPGNQLSYQSDVDWGGGHVTYINVNNTGR